MIEKVRQLSLKNASASSAVGHPSGITRMVSWSLLSIVMIAGRHIERDQKGNQKWIKNE